MTQVTSEYIETHEIAYRDSFLLTYQGTGRLRGTIQEKHGLEGSSYKSKLFDSLSMGRGGAYGSDIPASGVSTSAPAVEFEQFYLKTIVATSDQLNEKASMAAPQGTAHAFAAHRQLDQLMIDQAIANGTPTSAFTNGFTPLDITDLMAEMRAKSVNGKLTFAVTWPVWQLLMQSTTFTSSLFRKEMPLDRVNDNNLIANVSGVDIIPISPTYDKISKQTFGIPVSSAGVASCIMYSDDAMTLAMNEDPTMSITHVVNQDRFEYLTKLKGNVLVEQPLGVSVVDITEKPE